MRSKNERETSVLDGSGLSRCDFFLYITWHVFIVILDEGCCCCNYFRDKPGAVAVTKAREN
jgi:hypothetical protein